MTKVVINFNENGIDWGELVGKENSYFGYRVTCSSYDRLNNSCTIIEFTKGTAYENIINLNDTIRATLVLEQYGFEISFNKTLTWSVETISKVADFSKVGFSFIENKDGQFLIDGYVPQNFLTSVEIEHLLRNKQSRIYFTEIK